MEVRKGLVERVLGFFIDARSVSQVKTWRHIVERVYKMAKSTEGKV